MEEAPAGNYFMQSPAATEVETTSFPWPEEKAPTGILEDYKQYSSRVTYRVPVETDCPNHLGARPNAGEIYDNMNARSHEHFV